MVKRNLFGAGTPSCDSEAHAGLPKYRQSRPIPVRFVSICPKGHIEDFPFMEWVHAGSTPDNVSAHILSYRAGKSAALTGIRISCSCGKSRSMGGAFNFDKDSGGALSRIGHLCRGNHLDPSPLPTKTSSAGGLAGWLAGWCMCVRWMVCA